MKTTRFITALGFGLLSIAAVACGGADTDSDTQNAASIPYAEGSPEGDAVLAVANDMSLDFDAFNDDVALHKKAAENIIAHREGDGGEFDDLRELWGVSYCKTSCFRDLLDYAIANGYYGGSTGDEDVRVVFSPQPSNSTHLVEIAKWIDEAQETIDIAMYSYSNSGPVKAALENAVARGVDIRFLANTDLAKSASKGGALEEMGIDVRRVTKVMHHKFAIIDGPRDANSHDKAASTRIISGSGNWSSSAGTTYDENTLFMQNYPEMALRMQKDFDFIWSGSKDQVWDDSFVWDQTSADITDAIIADVESPDHHAFFTSANFTLSSGGSWYKTGTTVVTDQLVNSINNATDSIEIASGHFVNIPIAEAVASALDANPSLNVQIVIDCQEAAGGKYDEIDDALESIKADGGSVVYKCNTYRWHYKYAKQMHHKYMVVDGDELWTGSLNFSANSETNVFENMMQFTGPAHQELVGQYRQNFAMVQAYGTQNDGEAFTALMEDIETGSSIPLVWDPPISMEAETFKAVRNAINENCPATEYEYWLDEQSEGTETFNEYYQQNPAWFTSCKRNGYPWPNVPSHMRID